jgi:Putative peptidoglycan binding domain
MNFLFHKEFYNKVVSLFITLAFLLESTLLPIITLLPQTASAQAQSIVISRTSPAGKGIEASKPYIVGDETTSSSDNSPSLFSTNLNGTGYNQIVGTNTVRTFPFTTFDLAQSGACNASTGKCNIPGNWDAASFLCPVGVTDVQQMTEWYTIGNVTSNKLTWHFQCSGTTPTTNAQNPVGSLDGIDASGTASGWAVDPDSSAVSISVHFYIDGAAGQGGAYAGSAVANLSNANATYSGNHGYTFSIPSQWRDGKSHTFYAHGIDLSGDGSKNVLLSNVPKSFTLGTTLVSNNPVASVSPTSFVAGASFTSYITGAATNATIRIFSTGPDGVTSEDLPAGTTDSSGQFSRTHITTGWAVGSYRGWVTVNDVKSNMVTFTVTGSDIPPGDRPAPTPTTAPMATLTLERDQEQVLPNQPISFSGVLDASKVTFPQGSLLVMAISEGVAVERIEIDGRILASGEFSVNGGSIKIPFSAALYNGSHTFRIVLRNAFSVQLDRRVSIWVTAVDAGNTLLLKGRTASIMVAHLPTDVVGKGTSIALGTGYYNDNTGRTFRYLQNTQEIDVTRGPFFTPNTVPALSDNIAFTLFPGDASMQRIALSLKQFSDPLAREFITAQYQYLLGRDPSVEEVSRYLPMFTQWRNSLAALIEVYNRRADVREYVRVPEKVVTGNNKGKAIYASNLSSYDKLIEWATTQGWKEESSLQSFKMQTGFDDARKLFDALFEKWALLAAGSSTGWSESTTPSSIMPQRDSFSLIVEMCGGVVPSEVGGWVGKPDFAACWNNPLKRHQLILWAKDIGWAYNKVVQDWSVTTPGGDGVGDNVQTGRSVAEINPFGPILASVFGPGKYAEYAAEQQMRYPPAQLYYDLVSSAEYASFPEQRFRKNIDSIFRLFYTRPATESDIAWTKERFISYRWYKKVLPYDPMRSWITPQWEPNGVLVASDFNYVDEAEFLKNPSYITDYVYGTRNIPEEIDAVSARLLETIEGEKYQRTELYQGDNFKRIINGLYRLYYRRNPTDTELENLRAGGNNFGDIELKLNQSEEYGKTPASQDAIRSIYRNYLGKDPSDAEIGTYNGKTLSTIANKIGMSAEMKAIAQAHPENAYIFPIKKIKIIKCGFFCSVIGKAISYMPIIGTPYAIIVGVNKADVDHFGKAASIVLNSISRGFNEAGFDGETFVQDVSIARAIAGQAGGVFSMTNLMENADPTILAGFRTMAVAPQTPQGNAFAFASPLGAFGGLFGAKQSATPSGRLAQIDVSSHYGSGGVAVPAKAKPGVKISSPAKVTAPVSFTKTLAQGSRGPEVLKLQKVLGESDLTFLPEYKTGYYGLKTVAAVKRFQKRYGLEQVGFVGVKTRALLNNTR